MIYANDEFKAKLQSAYKKAVEKDYTPIYQKLMEAAASGHEVCYFSENSEEAKRAIEVAQREGLTYRVYESFGEHASRVAVSGWEEKR